MTLIMLINLFTSRVILSSLGAEDYGIYNVVGGVVVLFTIFKGPLSDSTRRFLTFELGKSDIGALLKVFSTSLRINLLFGIIVVVLAEVIGYFFVAYVLQIPIERLTAAFFTLHFSSAIIFLSIITVPFEADVIAHERMDFFAIISITEVILKLLIAYLLCTLSSDRLIFYSLLLVLVQLVVTISYIFFCRAKFVETRNLRCYDKNTKKKLFSFIGWSMTGGITGVCNSQGINMILNVFFGPTVNAARGVSIQVQGALSQLSSNVQQAINPQITKTYASGDLQNMHNLVLASSKFSYLLLFMISMPIFFSGSFILNIWLGEYPQYTLEFLRLVLILNLFSSLANPLVISNHATGKIRNFQIVVESISLMGLPLSYLYLKLIENSQPYGVYYILISVAIISQMARVIIVLPNISMSFREYLREVILPLLVITFINALSGYMLFRFLGDDNLQGFITQTLISVMLVGILTYFVALNKHQRETIINYILKKTFIKKYIQR